MVSLSAMPGSSKKRSSKTKPSKSAKATTSKITPEDDPCSAYGLSDEEEGDISQSSEVGSGAGGGEVGGSQNQRERQRQLHVNLAFLALRAVVPSHPPDKKMSKHEILRAAIRYIRVLETQLKAMDDQAREPEDTGDSHAKTMRSDGDE